MANNFQNDANCKALWRFESGALTADSKGGNTLINSGVDEDLVNFREGACSGLFVRANTDDLYIDDADLDSGFPLKSTESNLTFSICFWLRPLTISVYEALIYKSTTTPNMSFIIYLTNTCQIEVWISNNGTSWNYCTHASAISTNVWYHVCFTRDNADGSYRIRIWDDTNQEILGVDKTGTVVAPIMKNTEFRLSIASSSALNGNLDEVVVFNDVLSVAEIDAIRAGTYGAGQIVTMEAAIAGAGGVAGSVKPIRGLSSAIAGTGAMSAVAKAQRKIASIIAAAGGLDGDLSITTAVSIAAAIAAAGDLAAAAKVDRKIAAVVSAAGALIAELAASKKLAAAIAASGDLAGSLSIIGTIQIAALVEGLGGLVGGLKLSQKLAAVVSAAGGLAAVISADRRISAAIPAAGGLAAAIKTERSIAAAIAAGGDLAAAMKTSMTFAADLSASGSLAAEIKAERSIAAAIAGTGAISADLYVPSDVMIASVIAGHGSLYGILRGIASGTRTRVLKTKGGSYSTGKGVSRQRIVN